jgi:putative peptidoglycan lipid II flippase
MSIAFALMYMPLAAVAQSTAVAAMPTFSTQAALGRSEDLRATLAGALRGVLFLSVPAALGLVLLRVPLVAMLYQHGTAFTANSTAMVAWALLWYAIGLVGHSLLEVLVRVFYAHKDTRTPVMVGAGAMALNVGFSFLFSALFTALGWMPHGGLALANSLATALEVTLLFFLLRRRMGGLGGREVWRAVGQALLASAGMGLAVWAWLTAGAPFPAWVQALGGAALGGLIYAGLALVLRVPEAGGLLKAALRYLPGDR